MKPNKSREKPRKYYGKLRVDDEQEYSGEVLDMFETVLDKYGLWDEAVKRLEKRRNRN